MKIQSVTLGVSRKKVKIHRKSGNWSVDDLHIDSAPKTATWECPGCTIFVMFPYAFTPLQNRETEVSAKDIVTADLDQNAKGRYPYCILVQDEEGWFHLVEGNSPPEMIID